MSYTLERDGDPDLCAPTPTNRRSHLRRPFRDGRHTRRDQCVDRTDHVIGKEQTDLILRAPIGGIAALDEVAKHLVLERMIAPAPQEVGADGTRLVEVQ